jgi:hypothetical protein
VCDFGKLKKADDNNKRGSMLGLSYFWRSRKGTPWLFIWEREVLFLFEDWRTLEKCVDWRDQKGREGSSFD